MPWDYSILGVIAMFIIFGYVIVSPIIKKKKIERSNRLEYKYNVLISKILKYPGALITISGPDLVQIIWYNDSLENKLLILISDQAVIVKWNSNNIFKRWEFRLYMDQELMALAIQEEILKASGQDYENKDKLSRPKESLNEFIIEGVMRDIDKNLTELEYYKKANESDNENLNNPELFLLLYEQKLFHFIDRVVQDDFIIYHNFLEKKIPNKVVYISHDPEFSFEEPSFIYNINLNEEVLNFSPNRNILFEVHNNKNEVQLQYFNPYYFGLSFGIYLFFLTHHNIISDYDLKKLLTILSNKYGITYYALYIKIQGFLSEKINSSKKKKKEISFSLLYNAFSTLLDIKNEELILTYYINPLYDKLDFFKKEFS